MGIRDSEMIQTLGNEQLFRNPCVGQSVDKYSHSDNHLTVNSTKCSQHILIQSNH
jgi:hypothetical protein